MRARKKATAKRLSPLLFSPDAKRRTRTLDRLIINGPRVFRTIALPIPAFDALQNLKRMWGLATNAEVLTRLLLDSEGAYDRHNLAPLPKGSRITADTMKNAEDDSRTNRRDDSVA